MEDSTDISTEFSDSLEKPGKEVFSPKATEAKQSVEWSRRHTYNAKDANGKFIHDLLKERAVVVVGEDPNTGKTEIAMETPQFTVGSQKDVDRVRKEVDKRYELAVGSAERAGLISGTRAEEIRNEHREPRVRFQGLKEVFNKTGQQEVKGGGDGHTATTESSSVMNRREFLKKGVRILEVGGMALVATSCNLIPAHVTETPTQIPTKTEIPTSTVTSTPEKTNTPTETPTPTEAPVSTEWQLSPDGHVYYNESELYGGLFTINKEHPEYVEAYWEDTIKGLWNLNYVAQNNALLSKFPTSDSLIKYLKNGGKPISNFWIPVIYPNDQDLYDAAMMPVDGTIDLSKIEINIYKPTKDEIYKYSPYPSSGTKYISDAGADEEVMVEEVNIDNNNVLKLTFRKDMLIDGLPVLAFSDSKSGEDNLKAALQLIRFWNVNTQKLKRYNPDSGMTGWYANMNPPLLNLVQVGFSTPPDEIDAESVQAADLNNSPLSVR